MGSMPEKKGKGKAWGNPKDMKIREFPGSGFHKIWIGHVAKGFW